MNIKKNNLCKYLIYFSLIFLILYSNKKKEHLENTLKLYFDEENDFLLFPKNSEKIYKQYKLRVHTERLYRRIIYNLIKDGVIDKNKNIIDLGAWIGDNSLIWSKMINGKVYAIEPSEKNCKIMKLIKEKNKLKNLQIIKKVISNKNEKVYYKGNLTHTSFSNKKDLTKYKNELYATSLDNLLKNKIITNIGFIHLDVEGFEFKTLLGCENIIKKYKPIITTESHPGDKKVDNILNNHGYKGYIIPEICGANEGCRNTLWIPNEIKLENNITRLLNFSLVPHYSKNLKK